MSCCVTYSERCQYLTLQKFPFTYWSKCTYLHTCQDCVTVELSGKIQVSTIGYLQVACYNIKVGRSVCRQQAVLGDTKHASLLMVNEMQKQSARSRFIFIDRPWNKSAWFSTAVCLVHATLSTYTRTRRRGWQLVHLTVVLDRDLLACLLNSESLLLVNMRLDITHRLFLLLTFISVMLASLASFIYV